MTIATITLDNAINLIHSSNTINEINRILDEVGRLTYTKIKDIKNSLFTAIRLEKAGGNPFMIKVMAQAEKRKLEIENP